MKEKITRLKFRKSNRSGSSESNSKFKIRWNTNEDDEMLEISIHDADPVSGKEKQVLIPEKFLVKINNKEVLSIEDPDNVIKTAGNQILYSEAIITKMKDDGIDEAIYQFSLPMVLFTPKDENLVVIGRQGASANSFEEIGSLSFFTEAEDNFINVKLNRPDVEYTYDKLLWDAIKGNSLKFLEYERFIDTILCRPESVDKKTFSDTTDNPKSSRALSKIRSPFVQTEEYNLLKFGTEFYMLHKFGLKKDHLMKYLGSTGRLPYYDYVTSRIEDDLVLAETEKDCVLRESDRLTNPFMIELIWSYWMEQGMLVQTLNVINLRFQNIKGNKYVDPLLRFDVDPLRPLSHILWGYIQDEQHRLSLPRRLYEYDHEYGLTLTGKAVPRITPVDSRVPFLEAFHGLLNQCVFFFRESDDTTRIADAFPILNSLKEVHLLLAEGNHNAYGNLTWTARHEMMIQQYILSRPEMREFMGGKVMVPYPETWMDRVDTMRSMQGWGNTSIVYYYELAVHGEMILLSIRYGNWSDVTLDRHNAANWAQEFRNSIQRYIHAYRAVTGADLSVEQLQIADNFAIQPSFLIQQRLLQDKTRVRRA